MRRVLLASVLTLTCAAAVAGQPWFATSSGVPYHWNGGVVKWIYSSGDLSDKVTNAQAVKMVEDAFTAWATAGISKPGTGKVKTVDLTPVKVGMLTEKITKDNYLSHYGDTSKPSIIVFDTDGSIMADWCIKAKCDPKIVMAFTISPIMDPYSPKFLRGMTILNGPMVKEYGEAQFQGSVVHEIGHLLGLDHSGLNDGYATEHDEGPNAAPVKGKETLVPTMYPVNMKELGGSLASLHMDDVVAISALYPSENFNKEFCMITGKIVDSSGKGIQGLNVEAHSTGEDFGSNAVSTMTGADFPVPTQDGHYYLRGIIPKRNYTVQFSSLPQFNSGGSDIGLFDPEHGLAPPWLDMPPIKDPPEGICDKNIANCIATASGGSVKVVTCDKGGEVIVMDTTTVDNAKVSAQYATAPVPTVKEYTPTGAASSSSGSSGCALIR